MAELTDRELEILSKEIDKQGLTYTQLQKELLDHLCCDIEAKMDEGIEFLNAFEKVRKQLEKNRIQKIQEETLLLINQKYMIMKKFMYILGTIAPSLLIVGAVCKLQHWPGAGVLITLGTFLLAVVYLPVFAMVSIRDTRKKGKRVNKPLYIIGVVTGFIFLIGILFKVMHWPGAAIALTFSVLFTVVVFIPILVTHALRDKENQLQNFSILIFILAMMAVNIMVFALKVSKNVLTSMKVTTEASMVTSQTLEANNDWLLKQATQLDLAGTIGEQSDALDAYIQEIMAEIVLLTHKKNLAAVGMDNSIDLQQASFFDVNVSVSQVIFGDEKTTGKGITLMTFLESYKELLHENAGQALDESIDQMLNTDPIGNYQETWLSYNFNQAPMIGALNVLSNLHVSLRYLEGLVLRDILNTTF